MRKVSFKVLNSSREFETQQGWFHQFSQDYEQIDGGMAIFPVAIIETFSGEIKAIFAEYVQFLEPIKELPND